MSPATLAYYLAAQVLNSGSSPTPPEALFVGDEDCFIVSASLDGRFLGCRTSANGLGILDRARGERILNFRDSDDFSVYGPVISPDGSRIAASFVSPNNETHELRVIDVHGRADVIYLEAHASGEPLAWSRDGRFIAAFVDTSLAILAADGSSMRELIRYDASPPRDVHLAPDGRHVLFADYPEGPGIERDLFLLPIEGDGPRRLTALAGEELFPTWLADGSAVLFLRSRNGTSDAWLVPMDGDEPRGLPEKLHSDVGDIIPFALTDRGQLYSTRLIDAPDLYTAEIDFDTRAVVTAPHPATAELPGIKVQPSYSPDGNHLAFLVRRGWGPRTSLAIRDLDTGNEHVLASLRDVHLPAWSHDGASVLVRGVDAAGRRGTFALDRDSGVVSEVSPRAHAEARSRDAAMRDTHRAAVEELIALEDVRHLTVHPDGRRIAFTAGRAVFAHNAINLVLSAR